MAGACTIRLCDGRTQRESFDVCFDAHAVARRWIHCCPFPFLTHRAFVRPSPLAEYVIEKAFLAAGLLATGVYILSSNMLPTLEVVSHVNGGG